MNYEWIPAGGDRYSEGRGAVVDTLLLHSTATTMAGAIATFRTGSRYVSAHLIIDVDRVVQMVDFADTAWHAGSWPWNQRSIGIEHVDNGDSWGVRPEALYVNAVEVARWVRSAWPITQFVEHRSVVATACPAALDTGRIIDGVLMEMAFDPRANPKDLAFLDQRVRDLILNEPQLVGFALRRALAQYGLKPQAAAQIARGRLPSRAAVLKGHGRGKGK